MSNNIDLSIGDTSISIDTGRINQPIDIPPAYSPFVRKEDAELSLNLHPGDPDIADGSKVFEGQPIWALCSSNGNSVLKIYNNMPGLERSLVLAEDFAAADLYFLDNTGQLIDPFIGPTLELLMINYLAQGRGVIIHSCGIEKNGEGILFIGESGAGKSTMANLWNSEGGIEILSGRLRMESAVAETESLLLSIEAADFFDLLSNNIDIVKALFRHVIREFQKRD